jgi:5'-nucleotidase
MGDGLFMKLWLALLFFCCVLGGKTEAAEDQGKLRVLLTNDDGIHAEGLAALAREMRTLDAEVTVVAPSEDHSGYSHAITYRDPFRAEEVRSESGELFGYSVNGTPADAALLGINGLLADKRPDIVVSGINRGENLGAVAHLSGTVGAAMEATSLGIPAIAISLGRAQQMDYSYAARVAKSLVLLVRKHGLPLGTCLNVNVPALSENQIKGIVVVPQSNWRGSIFHEQRKDLFGKPYYLRGFSPEPPEAPADTDVGAFARGSVTVTPIMLDWTNKGMLKDLATWGIGKNPQ